MHLISGWFCVVVGWGGGRGVAGGWRLAAGSWQLGEGTVLQNIVRIYVGIYRKY